MGAVKSFGQSGLEIYCIYSIARKSGSHKRETMGFVLQQSTHISSGMQELNLQSNTKIYVLTAQLCHLFRR